jgi:hypothetical protein
MADLRRKQQPQPAERTIEPPARRTVNMPGLKGTIPFNPANMILTEAEKKVLKERFGWKEGDPIPQLSKIIKAEVDGKLVTVGADRDEILRGVKGSAPATYPEDTPDFQPPEVISIDNLPPEKRQEIEDSIRNMRQQAANPDQEQFIPRDPNIGNAMALAQQQSAQHAAKIQALRQQQEQVKVEDDRKAPVRPKAKITRTQEPVQPPPQIPTTPEPKAELPAKAEPEAEVRSTTGAQAELKTCQHCGWDLSKPDEAQVTAEDLKTFVAAMIGGKRFVKTYAILGGELQITFRAMTTKDADKILRQLFLDGRSGKVASPPEVFRRAQEYQLIVCLESVTSNNNAVSLPPIDQHELDEDNTTTGLPEVLDYVYEQALPQESLRRVVLALYAEFDNTLAKLEASAKRPDFSQAIVNSR